MFTTHECKLTCLVFPREKDFFPSFPSIPLWIFVRERSSNYYALSAASHRFRNGFLKCNFCTIASRYLANKLLCPFVAVSLSPMPFCAVLRWSTHSMLRSDLGKQGEPRERLRFYVCGRFPLWPEVLGNGDFLGRNGRKAALWKTFSQCYSKETSFCSVFPTNHCLVKAVTSSHDIFGAKGNQTVHQTDRLCCAWSPTVNSHLSLRIQFQFACRNSVPVKRLAQWRGVKWRGVLHKLRFN